MAVDLRERGVLLNRSLVLQEDHAVLLDHQAARDLVRRIYYDRLRWFTARYRFPWLIVVCLLSLLVSYVVLAVVLWRQMDDQGMRLVLFIPIVLLGIVLLWAAFHRKLELTMARGEKIVRISGWLRASKARLLEQRLDRMVRAAQHSAELAAIERYGSMAEPVQDAAPAVDEHAAEPPIFPLSTPETT